VSHHGVANSYSAALRVEQARHRMVIISTRAIEVSIQAVSPEWGAPFLSVVPLQTNVFARRPGAMLTGSRPEDLEY